MIKAVENKRDNLLDIIQNQATQITSLQQQLDWLKRQVFGAKSERFIDPASDNPMLPGMEFEAPVPEPEKQSIEYERRAHRNQTGWQNFPEDLPREEIIIESKTVISKYLMTNRFNYTRKIKAAMFVEIMIFNSYRSLFHVFGDIFKLYDSTFFGTVNFIQERGSVSSEYFGALCDRALHNFVRIRKIT